MLQRIENRIEFWAVLGPFIILASLLIGIFRLSPALFLMPTMALIALPLCWKWKWKGLFASLGLLLAVCFVIGYIGTSHERIWGIGIGLVLSCGLILTLLSFSQVKRIILLLQKQREEYIDENDALKESLQEIIQEHKKEWDNLSQEWLQKNNETAKLRIKLRVQEKDQKCLQEALTVLQSEKIQWLQTHAQIETQQLDQQALLIKIQQEMESLQNELIKRTEELDALKSAKVVDVLPPIEIAPIEEAPSEMIAQECALEVPHIEPVAEPAVESSQVVLNLEDAARYKEIEALHKQLRVQFEEKTAVLASTRRELFKVEGVCFSLQQAQKEQALSDDPYIRRLIKLIQIQENEKSSLEKEIEALQDIVTKSFTDF